jgi:hypothetical protein
MRGMFNGASAFNQKLCWAGQPAGIFSGTPIIDERRRRLEPGQLLGDGHVARPVHLESSSQQAVACRRCNGCCRRDDGKETVE